MRYRLTEDGDWWNITDTLNEVTIATMLKAVPESEQRMRELCAQLNHDAAWW